MKFYESGNKNLPVIMLIPGTCCHYSLFDKVLPELQEKFYTIVVSFDGFDEFEKTEYISMLDETLKIEKYIKDNFNNHISCIYGCSLGGSFASYLVQRGNINVDHIILGSSDMDSSNKLMASIKGKIMAPIMYKMISTGKLPNFMTKKLEKMKVEEPVRYEQTLSFLKSFMVPSIKNVVTEKSVYNQYASDLVTKIDKGIEKEGTTIHVFYALGMGKKYRKRYLKHFKNPDIREQNMNHETFFFCHPHDWCLEVFDCVFNYQNNK